jgi:dTDP-4-dehydrorhamnose reductase
VVGTLEEMSQRIVITGAKGRLGAALLREWKFAGEDVLGFSHAELDLGAPRKLHDVLDGLDFAVLVNCAAQTNVDRCETHQEEAMRINALGARELAEICARKRARCIHISTDYVFSGTKMTPYTEEDDPEPISHYGESKLAGELAVLSTSDRHLVARVSWVFGPDRPSFVDQILAKAKTEEKVAAIADKFAVPTYTLDVARMLRPLLFETPVGGVVHTCNTGDCSWLEYAQQALDAALEAGLELKTDTVEPLKLDEMKAFVAKRPRYSAMSNEKLANLTGQKPRSWRDAVREYVTLGS